MSSIDELKILIRENDVPYFEDEELEFWLQKEGSVEAAAYRCLIIKSENTTLSVSGLSASDTSSYFKRLASQYRSHNSGILE